jgi:hypothetical protein
MSSHPGNSTLRWSCNHTDHEHQSWEDADCCDILLPLVAQLQCGSGDTALSYGLSAITSDYVATTLMVNPDETYSRIYAQLAKSKRCASRDEVS